MDEVKLKNDLDELSPLSQRLTAILFGDEEGDYNSLLVQYKQQRAEVLLGINKGSEIPKIADPVLRKKLKTFLKDGDELIRIVKSSKHQAVRNLGKILKNQFKPEFNGTRLSELEMELFYSWFSPSDYVYGLIETGTNRKDTMEALTEFIDRTGIFFFCTQMGKGVIDELHPQYLGTAALSDHDFVHRAVDEADLVINVGHDAVEKPPFFMHEGGKKVIHLNFFPAEVDTHLKKYFNDTRFPMLPQRLVSIMRDTLADEDIITLDNGIYKIWFARNYKCYAPNTLLLDNALASMGAGRPSAMLAKLINPDKKVVVVCGDGGFMMNSQELETAVRINLDMVVIIINDGSYGMIKEKPQAL